MESDSTHNGIRIGMELTTDFPAGIGIGIEVIILSWNRNWNQGTYTGIGIQNCSITAVNTNATKESLCQIVLT